MWVREGTLPPLSWLMQLAFCRGQKTFTEWAESGNAGGSVDVEEDKQPQEREMLPFGKNGFQG